MLADVLVKRDSLELVRLAASVCLGELECRVNGDRRRGTEVCDTRFAVLLDDRDLDADLRLALFAAFALVEPSSNTKRKFTPATSRRSSDRPF